MVGSPLQHSALRQTVPEWRILRRSGLLPVPSRVELRVVDGRGLQRAIMQACGLHRRGRVQSGHQNDRQCVPSPSSTLPLAALRALFRHLPGLRSRSPHLHRDCAHPCPDLHRDCARPAPHLHSTAHVCTGTSLAPSTRTLTLAMSAWEMDVMAAVGGGAILVMCRRVLRERRGERCRSGAT
jgi:hypothetical protein